MAYLGSVTFQYPVDWVDAKRPVNGSTYTSINGDSVSQKILDTTVIGKPIVLRLSWIDHAQYESLWGYYNSVSTYTLQIISNGPLYNVVFQGGTDSFEFTPIVPEVPYSYRSLTAHTVTGSYYDGTIKLICVGVTGG